MKRYLLSLALLCFVATGAQSFWQSRQQVAISGGAAFVGPVDAIASPLGCWSLRACSSALRGQKVANVCNSTGGVDVGCADMLSDATTGDLVSQTISSITCPGANCTVKTLYFQTGSFACTSACDLTQATVANRPTLTTSCGALSKAFCMAWAGSTTQLSSPATTTSYSGGFTLSAVAKKTGGAETGITATTAGNTIELAFESFANGVFIFVGGIHNTATQADNAWHSFQGISGFGGTQSVTNVDGANATATTEANGGISSAAVISVGVDSFSQRMIGNSSEYLWYNSAFTTGNATTMCHNQFAYWGTSVSC